MTDETKYEWFHKDREFFFLKKDGEITHCYQLARELCSDVDKNQWWEVGAVVPKDLTRNKNITICADNGIRCRVDDLVPVPRDSEIEYQLFSLEDEQCPIAGVFMKRIREKHPRRNQWGELAVLNHIPESWLCKRVWTRPDDRDFVSDPGAGYMLAKELWLGRPSSSIINIGSDGSEAVKIDLGGTQ